MDFGDAAAALAEDLTTLRRRLHARPEVGLELPETQSVLREALAGLPLEITAGERLNSLTAVLRGGRPGPVVLLRADMDGLPITEATGLDFAAEVVGGVGTMHACGHDLHMTGLVGAVRLLAARQADLPGTVVFMFQPGEEGYAGARVMLEEGVLDAAALDGVSSRPVAAYALHVDSVLGSGVFTTRAGAVMASATGLTVRVSGTGGHAAYPHLGVDPIPVAAEIVLALQSFVARRVPAVDPAVVSVTRLASDSDAPNVLATTVEIGVNIRTFSRETLALVRAGLNDLVDGLANAHGATAELEWIESYPVAYNDPVETEAVLATLDELYGADRVPRMPATAMASEDFAYVLDEVPGTLFFLGARAVEPAPPMHSERTVFDEAVLPTQAAILATLAWRRLERGTP